MLRLRKTLLLPLAAGLMLLAASVAPSSANASERQSARQLATAPVDTAPERQPRRFPNLDLGGLTTAQQQQFMRVVDSELCPCEGSTQSLGECLESPSTICGLAREVTGRVYQGVQRNASDVAISRDIAEHIRESAKVHTFDLKDAPYKGARRPVVTMVSFADYECPYCRELGRITDVLLREYPDELRVYFLNFPLSGHRHAMDAAIAATAAQRQNQFWAFHDLIFANQMQLSQSMDAMPLFLRWAEELGLNLETFKKDLDDHTIYTRVQRERQSALDAGARGTPTIYLNGRRHLDIETIDAIRARIDALIKEAKQ